MEDFYNNFNNFKNIDINNNSIDLELFNLSKEELKKNSKKDIIIENILLDNKDTDIIIKQNNINNFLIYKFETNNNFLYKINCEINVNNIENIKLVITDESKKFIYDYKKNIVNYNTINNYQFILDNNQFTFDNKKIIYCYLFFDNKNEEINIKNISFNVIEKSIIKSVDSIIIFNINNKSYPLFTDTCNILDYIKYTDNSPVFFI
jgi:hypothetical protein